MRKSILIIALTAVLAVFAASSSTYAQATSLVSRKIPAGGRLCTDAIPGYVKVYASGSATGRGALWTLQRSPTGATYDPIYTSLDFTAAVGPYFTSQATPRYFSGFFKLCARNNDTKEITVNMQVQTDGDAPIF